jgi:hypothetical protein
VGIVGTWTTTVDAPGPPPSNSSQGTETLVFCGTDTMGTFTKDDDVLNSPDVACHRHVSQTGTWSWPSSTQLIAFNVAAGAYDETTGCQDPSYDVAASPGTAFTRTWEIRSLTATSFDMRENDGGFVSSWSTYQRTN